MAYVNPQQEQQNAAFVGNAPVQNPNPPGANLNPNNNQPLVSSGAGSVTPTGAANVTGQVTGTATPQQPFQNIAQYLKANAPGAQQLTNQIAGNVSAPIQQIQGELGQDLSSFNTAVNAGYTPLNQDILNQVQNNTVAAAANPQTVQSFQQQLGSKYTGPTDFTTSNDYSTLESNIANAQANAALAQNPTGVQTLLNQAEGPTTAGVNTLDTLLLAQNPQAMQQIAAAGAPAQGLTQQLNAITNVANSSAKNAPLSAATVQQEAQQALQPSQQQLAANLANELAIANTNTTSYNDTIKQMQDIQSNLAAGNTDNYAPGLQNFWANNVVPFAQNTPGFTLNTPNYVNALATIPDVYNAVPTNANVATPQDYALSNALAILAGSGYTPPLNQANVNQAGTFAIPNETIPVNPVNNATVAQDMLTALQSSQGNLSAAPFQTYNTLINSLDAYLKQPPLSTQPPNIPLIPIAPPQQVGTANQLPITTGAVPI